MECQLCGENKKLIEAHIIPKWAYDFLYSRDDEERKKALLSIGANRYNKRRPTGSYDSEILCEKCDNLIGNKYDDMGKNFFVDEKIHKDGLIEKIDKPDISILRLFVLSVVWRSSISNIEEFSPFSIGSYSQILRNIIFRHLYYGEISEDLNNFSVIITRYSSKSSNDSFSKTILFPYHTRIDGVNTVCIFFPNSFKLFAKFDKRDFPPEVRKFDINNSGDIVPIITLGNIEDAKDYGPLINAVHKSKSRTLNN